MFQAPLFNKRPSLGWQVAPRYISSHDIDQCFEALILHMYVRRRVIIVPHADDNAEKDGENRHALFRLTSTGLILFEKTRLSAILRPVEILAGY